MLSNIKSSLKRNYYIYTFISHVRSISHQYGGVKIENHGGGKIVRDVLGINNAIVIGANTFLDNTKIRIRGNNNKIIFGESVHVGEKCSFWMEGDNILISIGSKTTFTNTVHFCAQEKGQSIQVGEDCMFSNNIIVRTSDSHPIYDEDGKRINMPKPVKIGNHVWIAPNTKIMKGAYIHDGCVIGSNTMVSKEIPDHSLAVGQPAKVVKKGIKWTKDILF